MNLIDQSQCGKQRYISGCEHIGVHRIVGVSCIEILA
jgi:hypothetical protein